MDEKNAIHILIDVANIAQKGGLLSLQEAVLVFDAIKTLTAEKKPANEVDKKKYGVYGVKDLEPKKPANEVDKKKYGVYGVKDLEPKKP